MSENQGKLVVISGPSGAGKTSVCRALKRNPNVEFSISATTRAMRAGEQDGVDYHFLSRVDFQRRLDENQFLEWASYNGNLYGTPRWPMDAALARGKVFLLEIEVDGTRQLRERSVDGFYLFIAPPSIAELRRRLIARGSDSVEEIEQRVLIASSELALARSELASGPLYDVILENSVLEETITCVEGHLWP
jgi:guanylate kinase